jgi:hypothetical protein
MRQAPASNEKKHKIIVHSLTPTPFSAFLSRDLEKKSAKLPMVFFSMRVGEGKMRNIGSRPGMTRHHCGGASPVSCGFVISMKLGHCLLRVFSISGCLHGVTPPRFFRFSYVMTREDLGHFWERPKEREIVFPVLV